MIPFADIVARDAARKGLAWAQQATTDPLHYWNSPIWLRSVDASFPGRVFGRLVSHAVCALLKEQLAAEEWRAKRGFAS